MIYNTCMTSARRCCRCSAGSPIYSYVIHSPWRPNINNSAARTPTCPWRHLRQHNTPPINPSINRRQVPPLHGGNILPHTHARVRDSSPQRAINPSNSPLLTASDAYFQRNVRNFNLRGHIFSFLKCKFLFLKPK